jgi:hypothetical protein
MAMALEQEQGMAPEPSTSKGPISRHAVQDPPAPSRRHRETQSAARMTMQLPWASNTVPALGTTAAETAEEHALGST